MKKILNEITEWTGWFFCEMSFRIWDWSFLYVDDDNEEYKWYFRPYVDWTCRASYTIGCYFYGFETERRQQMLKVKRLVESVFGEDEYDSCN